MADFFQDPPSQPLGVTTIAAVAVAASTLPGTWLYVASPELTWDVVGSTTGPNFGLAPTPITFTQRNVDESVLIFDVITAFLTTTCPPVPVYPASGQRWWWGFGPQQ